MYLYILCLSKILSLVLWLTAYPERRKKIPKRQKPVKAKGGFVFESQIRFSPPLSDSPFRASSCEWKREKKLHSVRPFPSLSPSPISSLITDDVCVGMYGRSRASRRPSPLLPVYYASETAEAILPGSHENRTISAKVCDG